MADVEARDIRQLFLDDLKKQAIDADTTEGAFRLLHKSGNRATSIHSTLGRTMENSQTFFDTTEDERKVSQAMQTLGEKLTLLPEGLVSKIVRFMSQSGFSADGVVEVLNSIENEEELGRLPGVLEELKQLLDDAEKQADRLKLKEKQKDNFIETAVNAFFHKNEVAHGSIGFGTKEEMEKANALEMTQTGLLREHATEKARELKGPKKLLDRLVNTTDPFNSTKH